MNESLTGENSLDCKYCVTDLSFGCDCDCELVICFAINNLMHQCNRRVASTTTASSSKIMYLNTQVHHTLYLLKQNYTFF